MPLRLNSWIAQQGGLRDPGGNIRHILRRYKDRPGLVSHRGMTLDDAALRASEAGYFYGQDRPSINDLLDAIAQDEHGRCPVFSEKDMAPERREEKPDRVLDLLNRLVAVYRDHQGGGKRKAMRPLLRECEVVLRESGYYA